MKTIDNKFQYHKLIKEREGQYLCTPETTVGYSEYWFRVCFLPKMILFYGDCYTLTLEMSDTDSERWLRRCINSKDYVLGKSNKDVTMRFSHEFAQETLDDHLKQGYITQEQYEEIIEADWHDDYPDSAFEFYSAYYDITGDSEIPDCTVWTQQTLLQYEALYWLVDALEKAEIAERGEIVDVGV